MGLHKKLADLLKSLEMQNAPEIWHEYWEPSMALYISDDFDFLTDEYFSEANHLLHLNNEIIQAFFNALSIIRKSPALCQLAWLWKYIAFSSGKDPDDLNISDWPSPVSAMGSSADMLHAVVLVSGIPKLQEFYKSRKLPNDVFLDTLSDVGICMKEYRAQYGVYGVGVFRMGWLLNHFNGMLFKLGRLQFIHTPYETIREKVEFLNDDLEAVLSKGDAVLDTHITSDCRMDYESCRASYKMALEFFPKYFPEKKFKGFTCFSWLLNPALRLLLPGDSNIVKFQSDFYLIPVLGDESVFEYVFGGKPDDLSMLPSQTSLQRRLRDYLMNGNALDSAGGFILKENINC